MRLGLRGPFGLSPRQAPLGNDQRICKAFCVFLQLVRVGVWRWETLKRMRIAKAARVTGRETLCTRDAFGRSPRLFQNSEERGDAPRRGRDDSLYAAWCWPPVTTATSGRGRQCVRDVSRRGHVTELYHGRSEMIGALARYQASRRLGNYLAVRTAYQLISGPDLESHIHCSGNHELGSSHLLLGVLSDPHHGKPA